MEKNGRWRETIFKDDVCPHHLCSWSRHRCLALSLIRYISPFYHGELKSCDIYPCIWYVCEYKLWKILTRILKYLIESRMVSWEERWGGKSCSQRRLCPFESTLEKEEIGMMWVFQDKRSRKNNGNLGEGWRKSALSGWKPVSKRTQLAISMAHFIDKAK